jgi:hypothetical protein
LRHCSDVRCTTALPPKAEVHRRSCYVARGRVEDGRGRLGHVATRRFPSPLIEPDVPISGIRLSDWFHREAHGEETLAASVLCAAASSPSPYDTAFSERSGSQSVFTGSSPITFTSPSSKAHQKSGSFPPPALPGFNGRMTLSDSRQCRRLEATLRPLPSLRTGLPRLPASPFRRAVPTTPADRAGAHVDCFPAHAAFPKWQEGRHPHCHFRGLPRLHSRYGPPDRSAAQGNLCHEAPTRAVARTSRSSATGSIDNSPGGIFLH